MDSSGHWPSRWDSIDVVAGRELCSRVLAFASEWRDWRRRRGLQLCSTSMSAFTNGVRLDAHTHNRGTGVWIFVLSFAALHSHLSRRRRLRIGQCILRSSVEASSFVLVGFNGVDKCYMAKAVVDQQFDDPPTNI